MLTHVHIQRFKSLYDVEVDLEPLTVFIGPNGSGKSNVCEALDLTTSFFSWFDEKWRQGNRTYADFNTRLHHIIQPEKYWHGETEYISFRYAIASDSATVFELQLPFRSNPSRFDAFAKALGKVSIYDLNPALLSQEGPATLQASGEGIANSLADIVLDHRERFNELEQRFVRLVPNISRIALRRKNDYNLLFLVDKYSEHLIPASDISNGTLRILGVLTALYHIDKPDILCFEEPENGIHPWLLPKIVELFKLVSTEGITGKPVQILVTTHSPVLLNYVEPHQIRAVELDDEGKTQIHPLPTDSEQFVAALDAYDGDVGELWFTNVFGANPV